MAFRLRVTFTGLCMFVPEVGKKLMHVIMPTTRGPGPHHHGEPSEEHAVERHVVRLAYDTAYARPRATELDGVSVFVQMEKLALELPKAVETGSADLRVDPRIASMEKLVNEKVKPHRVRRKPELTKVLSRVTLAQGNMPGDGVEPGAEWTVKDKNGNGIPMCMAFSATWVMENVDMPNNELPLELLRLDNENQSIPLPRLHAINQEDDDGSMVPTIDLHVFHVPKHELPPIEPEDQKQCEEPKPEDPVSAPHFTTYSRIFDTARLDTPVLRKCECSEGIGGPVEEGRKGVALLRGGFGSFYTCMLSSAPLEE